MQIDPISISYTELLPRLIQNQYVARVPFEPLKPPFPRWYDSNAHCDYHYGIQGHSTENCIALKRKVQGLINTSYLSFDKPLGPNVTGNPLSNHAGLKINAISED